MSETVYPYEGGRCPHGSATICPHCEPRRFKVAYVQAMALLAYGQRYTEEEAASIVDKAADAPAPCAELAPTQEGGPDHNRSTEDREDRQRRSPR